MAIAGGTSGTCTWSISDSGALTIAPTSGSSGYVVHEWLVMTGSAWPWHDYRSRVTSVEVSGSVQVYGRNVYGGGVTLDGDAAHMFSDMENMASASGIGGLVGLTELTEMFYGCSSLTSLDLSSLDTSAATAMWRMFGGCSTLTEVTFGPNFAIPGQDDTGFVQYGKSCKNATNGIVVTSDADFSALTAAQRQGTWRRGVSASYRVTASRSSGGAADEDGEDVTISAVWATDASTTARTLKVFMKQASASSSPSTATKTVTLSGNSGSADVTISSLGDGAYDFRVEFYDGTSTFVAFPSVQSNIRLLTLDDDGTIELMGSQIYPTFVWDSTHVSPESYSGTYPVSPCFVYYVPNNGLYYCEN